MQNVSARRTERINSDEEERARRGYDLRTGLEWAEVGGRPSHRTSTAHANGNELATLTYGERATLWRINLGWAHRDTTSAPGFRLDVERGYWAKADDDSDPDDPMSRRTETVIPYVEDRRNTLVVHVDELATLRDVNQRHALSAGLRAALKNAIQVEFNLEDSELAAEPLPSRADARLLLFFEASEGGAGVLRRLVDDPTVLPRVARRALDLCHFNPDTGEDQHRAPGASEDCMAACYDCLLSYMNQPDHRIIDRYAVRDVLIRLASAKLETSPTPATREEHLERLERLCDSELERRWLRFIAERGYRLPDTAQKLIADAHTKPDFIYDDAAVAVYIDGPVHTYGDRAARDATQQAAMEDLGWTVLRFRAEDDWPALINQHKTTFGVTG
jgi:hypothetical protein